MAASHLVILFTATAGQNAENLGSDEEQIVLFVYLLYDVANNKAISLQHHYVRPRTDDISEPVLTEECKAQTGLSEDVIKNAQPLEQVLDEFDRYISSKEVHPDHGGRPFCFVTDGQLHMRLGIHPEATSKGINLSHYFSKFFDLRKEFKKYYKTENINCIKDMLNYLGLEGDQSVEYGVRHAQEMAKIIQRLINDGHEFTEAEVVKDRLEPGICAKSDYVDDETVIRARGLPWQSSDGDIAKFFKGLNVAKGGVALCLSQQGRRNGEALIRFESKEHRDLAIRKHKHHLGQRYIEVYKASGKDFVNIAGGNNSEAQAFLSRHGGNGGQVIVRMRGLPYTCTAEQVLEFFKSGENACNVLDGEEGILFVHQADGRATGDAFVLFGSDDEANKALTKHRESIGARYIELFKSTTAEVQQVLNRSMDPRNPVELPETQMPPLIPQIPSQTSPIIVPQQLITSGTQKDCIRLRGLPFESTVTDILTFLGEHARNIVFQGVHMVYNAQGTPSGEAFIQMDSEQSAELAAANKHKKFMFMGNKKRYIEVLQSSGEDMNMVLSHGGVPPTMGAIPQASNIAVLPQASVAMPTTPQSQFQSYHAAALQQLQQRPLVSPGGSMVPPAVAPATAFGGMYPYTQLPQHPMVAAPAHATTAATLPPHMTGLGGLTPTIIPQRPPAAAAAAATTTNPYGYHQPLLYWYPSPPVSPQSAYYVPQVPTTVVLKGLPFNAGAPEILSFFEGIYEQMQPDVQLTRTQDGRGVEALVTFASRAEAERAITERNRKIMGNRLVELHMA